MHDQNHVVIVRVLYDHGKANNYWWLDILSSCTSTHRPFWLIVYCMSAAGEYLTGQGSWPQAWAPKRNLFATSGTGTELTNPRRPIYIFSAVAFAFAQAVPDVAASKLQSAL